MSSEIDKICGMLDSAAPELQCAAAMVLGELKPDDAAVKKALTSALKSDNEAVALYSLDALAKIDATGSLIHIIPLLGAGESLAAKAREVLIAAGPKAVETMRDKMEKADPAVRRGILEILGQSKDVDTSETLFESFLDPDLEVVKQATAAFRTRIEGTGEADRKETLKAVLAFLNNAKVKKNRSATIACLKLLATLKDAATAKVVLGYLDKKLEVPLRSNALFTLNALPADKLDAKLVVAKLLPLLEEEDFGNILKPALDVLAKVAIPKDFTEKLLKLTKSPQPSVRHWALRTVGSVGSTKTTQALLDTLLGDDARLADTASQTLRGDAKFIPSVLRVLLAEKDGNKQWKLGNVLRSFRDGLDARTTKTLLNRLTGHLDKKEAQHGVYFEILRGAAPEAMRETIHKRGRDFLLKKKHDEAERFLRLLERDDLATPETDYTLAIALLKTLRTKDIAFAARDRSHSSTLFSKIIKYEKFPLLKTIEKDARLFGAPDLLYLGFVFSERQGPERDFGLAVLKILGKRFGNSEEGKTAKNKLKTQGG